MAVFGLQHFELDGEEVACITRDDGRFETLQLVDALMDLARDNEEGYMTVCNLIFMLRDFSEDNAGIEA